MTTKLMLGTLILMLAVPAAAVEKAGTFALGFSDSDAPVAVRYFSSETLGFDLGLGLESTDLGDESASSLFFEGGVTYVVKDYEDAFFFVRPAIAYKSLDDRVYGSGTLDDTWTVLELQLNLGGEVRLADRFGLTFQHGLALTSTDAPGDGDKLTDFGTRGENVTMAGVWFTF